MSLPETHANSHAKIRTAMVIYRRGAIGQIVTYEKNETFWRLFLSKDCVCE